jgi:hypothetical protein
VPASIVGSRAAALAQRVRESIESLRRRVARTGDGVGRLERSDGDGGPTLDPIISRETYELPAQRQMPQR